MGCEEPEVSSFQELYGWCLERTGRGHKEMTLIQILFIAKCLNDTSLENLWIHCTKETESAENGTNFLIPMILCLIIEAFH